MLKGINTRSPLHSSIKYSMMVLKTIDIKLLSLLAGLFFLPYSAIAKSLNVENIADLSLEQLTEIKITSVSREEEKLSDAASAIQVITSDDIRRSGATNIPEALRLATNLQVAQTSAHGWVISARGFSSDVGNKLLVLIDGRTVYTPLFSGVFWDRQDYLLEDIDRIEVISGPGGTLWGSNAVNGVINIITKKARDTQGVYFEAGGGTELKGFTGVRYGGSLTPDVNYRVYGKFSERDGSVVSNGTKVTDAWDAGQGGFRLDATPGSQNVFTLQGDYYNNDEGIPTGGNSKIIGANILGRWTHSFSKDSEMSLQLYYDKTRLTLPTPASPLVIAGIPLAPAGIFMDSLDTYDMDFQHSFRLGMRNRVIWGLGYRFTHDEVVNAPNLAFLPTHLDQQLFSGFIQDEFTLIPNRLSLTLGTKLEHNDYTGLEIVPSGRIQWNIKPDHTLWAAVSRAVRTPSRIDRDISQPAPGVPPFFIVLLSGGSEFDSETVVAYELGYRGKLSSRIFSSLSFFYNDYNKIRSTSFSPTVLPLFFENNVEGKTYGFELNLNYQVNNWLRLTAGYNLLREDIDVKAGRFDFNNALNETADPEHQFSIRSFIDLPQDVELDAGLRWVDTLRINNAGTADTVPSYFELDVRLGWKPINNLEFSIAGQNLLHDHHPEFGLTSPDRREIERGVYGKMVWRF